MYCRPQSDKPVEANLLLTSREATNFMSSKFSESAMVRMVAELNKEVEEEYWRNVYVSMRQIGTDLGKAKDGANELYDGLVKMDEGNAKITNGLSGAETGSKKLQDGLNDLTNGGSDLSSGLSTAKNGSSSLVSGLGSISTGLGSFSTNMGTLQTGLTQVQGGVLSSKTAIDQAIQLLADPTNIETVKAMLSGVSGGLSTVNNGVTSISTGVSAANLGVAQLTAGTNKALAGANQLNSGLSSLYDGSVKLNDGLNTAKDGSDTLHNGLVDLTNGSRDLGKGVVEAKDGSKTLADELAKGQKEIAKKSSKINEDKQVPMLSAPVSYESKPVAKVANNGTGFAPYFIPLALWVGAMAIFFIMEKPKFVPKTIIIFGMVGIGQTVLLGASLMGILGMKVMDLPAFLLFSISLSWCYMLIQALINHLFGDAGKFVNILLLMLQITSSAGSYPLETSPAFFQNINPFLPMTYAVTALREIISGGDFVLAISQTRVIIIIGCVFFGLNALREVVSIRYAKNDQKN